MAFYLLLQPEEGTESALVERAQGHPSLVISSGDARLTVQIAGQEDGAQLAIKFARELAGSAAAFADRCEALTKLAPLDFEHLAALVGTTPEEVDALTAGGRDEDVER
ncbi:hypothetical protein ABZ816_35140 [Actinosynnema sp. NPDC047251]|uniref:Uncharacterized protein n=1 Tax=Saccharothrix espanaensis (strain ATCC 51144 / DSM 44229 / JCM 9112 / NBRC 15066 / NRRL 15764) TaxID=1179773 RepID=K0JPE5_SACES|nr:hypothetical protein [Saccharothrix espanaensis]CCH28560.1 hypothetical protein BN6_12340 [Saccharothrix espanaensis DSM 44229]